MWLGLTLSGDSRKLTTEIATMATPTSAMDMGTSRRVMSARIFS